MILIAGGAGYIGSHTVKQLLNAGYDVAVFDNLSRGHRELVLSEHFIQGDLLDIDSLREAFERFPIDAVMHFAALTSVGESVSDPQAYYRNNVTGTLNLLDAMRHHNVDRLVFSSSAAVYGNPEQVPISEEHPKLPMNPYGRTKWMVEQAIADYGRAYGLRSVSLRYFNAAGSDPEGDIGEWHEPETHLIPIVFEAALKKRPHVEIFGTDYDTADGTCIRDYIHVADLAEAHVLGLEYLSAGGSSKAFNLGTGEGHSVREVIDVCRETSGRQIPVLQGPRRPGDPPVLVADPSLARDTLQWESRHPSLEDIVATAWSWMTRRSTKPKLAGSP
jgi:UDP-glucose 4-epimerase